MLQSVTKLLEHFWRFANYKKGEYKAFPPTSSTQSCSAVRATCCRQRTPKLWMEGRKEGCGLFCVLRSYLILGQCLNNFVVDCSLLLENFLYLISRFFQIDDMINELKFRDYVATGKYVTEIDLGQFIRRKYCTNNWHMWYTCTMTCNTTKNPTFYYAVRHNSLTTE